jgi:hypothetical protein
VLGCWPAPDANVAEIAVPRRQIGVLHRQVSRPRHMPADRMLLATLARLLPRERWPAFLVTHADSHGLSEVCRRYAADGWPTPRHCPIPVGARPDGLDPTVGPLSATLTWVCCPATSDESRAETYTVRLWSIAGNVIL